MTIVEFLEARISEDEKVAKAASIPAHDGYAPHPELSQWMYEAEEVEYAQTPEMLSHKYPQTYYVTMDSEGLTPSVTEAVGPHIARHDPARVLRECAAKRAILAQEEEARVYYDHIKSSATAPASLAIGHVVALATVIRHLASAYADHPDYDPAWATT